MKVEISCGDCGARFAAEFHTTERKGLALNPSFDRSYAEQDKRLEEDAVRLAQALQADHKCKAVK